MSGGPPDLQSLLMSAGARAEVVEHLQSYFGRWTATGFFTAEPRGDVRVAIALVREWLGALADEPSGEPCSLSIMLIEAPARALDPADVEAARRSYDLLRSKARSFPRQKEWADQLIPTVLGTVRESRVVEVLSRDLVVKIGAAGVPLLSRVAGPTSKATGSPPTPFLTSIVLVAKHPHWVKEPP